MWKYSVSQKGEKVETQFCVYYRILRMLRGKIFIRFFKLFVVNHFRLHIEHT